MQKSIRKPLDPNKVKFEVDDDAKFYNNAPPAKSYIDPEASEIANNALNSLEAYIAKQKKLGNNG